MCVKQLSFLGRISHKYVVYHKWWDDWKFILIEEAFHNRPILLITSFFVGKMIA